MGAEQYAVPLEEVQPAERSCSAGVLDPWAVVEEESGLHAEIDRSVVVKSLQAVQGKET
jgi:hypothetical protein